MTKKKLSIASVGNIRKPERLEPTAQEPKAIRRGRVGRPAERTPYVQLNSRVTLETSQQIDAIMECEGWTLRKVVEQAISDLHRK